MSSPVGWEEAKPNLGAFEATSSGEVAANSGPAETLFFISQLT